MSDECHCGLPKNIGQVECPKCWRQVPHTLKAALAGAADTGAKRAAVRMIIQWRKSAVLDEAGNELEIGMRIGCRNLGQRPSESRRGLTLRGYDRGHEKPYITDAGRFALAIKDHQPDLDEWRNEHVEESPADFRRPSPPMSVQLHLLRSRTRLPARLLRCHLPEANAALPRAGGQGG